MTARDAALAVLVSVIWGLNFVMIKVGLEAFPPFLFSALRFALAATPVIFLLRGSGVDWPAVLAVGMVLGVVKFSLMFMGIDVGLPAGLASLLIQAQVFFSILLATVAMREAAPSRVQVLGMLLGAAGLLGVGTPYFNVILLEDAEQISGPVLGFLLTLAAALAWGISNLVMRARPQRDLFGFMTRVSVVPVLPLLFLSFLFEGQQSIEEAVLGLDLMGIAAIVYVSFVATTFAYSVWGHLLAKYEMKAVTPYALLVPVVGMVAGHLVLGEDYSAVQVAGAGLLLVGLTLCTGLWPTRAFGTQSRSAGPS